MSGDRGNRFPLLKSLKSPQDRALFVATEFEKFGQCIAPYVLQVRADFRALRTGQTIMGCVTWTQFCGKVLKRTTRAVRYIMRGGNPRWKRKRSEKPTHDWREHWKGMPDFHMDDLTAFQRIVVNCADQEAVDKFATLIGQKITPKTRSISYPKEKKVSYANFKWMAVKPQPGAENSGQGERK